MMAPVLAIWRQPVAERRALGSLGLTWCLLALFLLATLSLAMPSPKRLLLFAILTSIPMSMLLLMWWIYLCANVTAQCHRAALQLVPNLGAQVQRAVVVAWLAIIAIMTLLAGVPTGHPGLVAFATALILIEAGVMGSFARYAIFGLACLASSYASEGVTDWLAWFIATPAAIVAGAALVLLDGAVALRRLAQGKQVIPFKENGMASLKQRRADGLGGRQRGWCEPAIDPQPAYLRPLGRSWFSLHLFTIGMVALVCAGLRLWAAWEGKHDIHAFLAGNRWMLGFAMFGVLAAIVHQESQRFSSARTEQALLCLTPAAPERPAMNRLLARGLLTGFVRTWLILCLLTMVALSALGAQPPELTRLAAVWVLALPLGGYALRDFARAGNPSGWPGALVLTLLGGACTVAVNGQGGAGVWLGLAGGACFVSLAVARWRWHAMLAAAPALPAGRIAWRDAMR